MRHVLLACALPLVAAAAATADGAAAVVGLWQTEPTDHGFARVEISASGGVYSGRIVWLSEPEFPPGDEAAGQPKVDRLNPDPGLRDRPIVGLQVMGDFSYAGDGRWKDGRIYDPESGKTYKAKIELAEDGTLRLRGFIGISLLGRTTTWVRAPEG